MDYFSHLPSEITLDILIRVPTESVLECKLVCTDWRNRLHHPSFSKMHFNHHHLSHHSSDSGMLGFIALTNLKKNDNLQYFEYNENLESIDRITRFNCNPPFGDNNLILGSCNGLICFARFPCLAEKTYICNPITREFIMLPDIKIVGWEWDGVNGFGYVTSTNEFKVVKIMSENNSDYVQIYVYTLGSGNGWRNVGKINYGIIGVHSQGCIFFNGTLYWLDHVIHMIVIFDLAEEEFGEHLSPPLPRNDDFDVYYQLGVLDGCLSFAINHTDVDGNEYWDMFLLKKTNDNHCIKRGKHQSLGWSKECKVYDQKLFAVTKSHAVLTYNANHINIHEASTSKRIVEFKEHFEAVFPHRNTLVSLKELGEEDTKIMESVEVAETENHDQPFNQL